MHEYTSRRRVALVKVGRTAEAPATTACRDGKVTKQQQQLSSPTPKLSVNQPTHKKIGCISFFLNLH
jgi:hypothetical protein